jgi:hypothetical protein
MARRNCCQVELAVAGLTMVLAMSSGAWSPLAASPLLRVAPLVDAVPPLIGTVARGGVARGPRGGMAARGPRGGAVARGPRGGAAVRGPYGGAPVRGPYGAAAVRGARGVAVGRPTVASRPGYGYGGWTRPAAYWWRPGGAIAAGAALGFVTAAAATAYVGQPPAPGSCWYYTNPQRTQGFWDACPR